MVINMVESNDLIKRLKQFETELKEFAEQIQLERAKQFDDKENENQYDGIYNRGYNLGRERAVYCCLGTLYFKFPELK